MMITPRPHDLVWIADPAALRIAPLAWVRQCWHPGLPLVVRRDWHPAGLIPVGVRGNTRARRAPGWIPADAIVRCLSPETLVTTLAQTPATLADQAPIQAARRLAERPDWPWVWGITGSAGYALATGLAVLHEASDLDLIIRAPQPLNRCQLADWCELLSQLPCRADTQVETPVGAFAVNEWLKGGRNLLVKTATGPLLMVNPWQPGVQS